ncbi:MAG: 6,7-dimethyl-8-ribityllumazine synthase [Paracoccaceae bacterium]|nr:MAG: 6,7-dimethyl-8-ribityllumazine synthase [Alphaproteobacteria bacterium]GIX14235.1 MAG: 6,7-dimethyl-8-ribityllumazine synthase [Paracoccaceae bacterium]
MAGQGDRIRTGLVLDPPPQVLLVVAPYYAEIAAALDAGARAMLARTGARVDRIDVPGALEIPGAIALAARHYEGFVALGCVIRGETSHYDIVAGESARGLMELTLRGLAIGNGILTVDNPDQAMRRARDQDKGGDAAAAALQLIALARRFGAPRIPAGGAEPAP